MGDVSKDMEVGTSAKTSHWYLIVFVVSLLVYIFTCAPGILWHDSGLYVYRIWHNDIEGKLGLALAHPLYFIIGIGVKHIPFCDLAYRINLLSAVCGAVAIANLFLILRLWLNKVVPAIVGAITLGISWTFWQLAVVAETDTLTAALLFFEILMLLQYTRTKQIKYVYLLGVFNGLSFSNHMLAVFSFICYFAFLVFLMSRKEVSFKEFGITAVLWVAAALPYEYLIIREVITTGDVLTTLKSAVFGNLWKNQVLNTSISKKIILENIMFILYTFPTPNIALFFIGLYGLWKKATNKSLANILCVLLIVYFIFAFRYTIPSRHTFFLPFYCISAIIIGLGADEIIKRFKQRAILAVLIVGALLPVLIYSVTPPIAGKIYKPLGQRRQRPYRDEYIYFLQPWKNNCNGAGQFATEALNQVERNAIIYAYTTDVHALLYMQQVKGLRRDVKIVSDFDSGTNSPEFTEYTIERLMEEFAIYVNSPLKGYCPDFILENFDFAKSGILWKVVDKRIKSS